MSAPEAQPAPETLRKNDRPEEPAIPHNTVPDGEPQPVPKHRPKGWDKREKRQRATLVKRLLASR